MTPSNFMHVWRTHNRSITQQQQHHKNQPKRQRHISQPTCLELHHQQQRTIKPARQWTPLMMRADVGAAFTPSTVARLFRGMTRAGRRRTEVLCPLGPNITDTYLKARDGTPLFTVRPDNWNETLGQVSASEIAVVAGNTSYRQFFQAYPAKSPLEPVTLRDVLRSLGDHGLYAGLGNKDMNLSMETLDSQCSIRFQTTFLPVVEPKPAGFSFEPQRATMEFTPEAYNYQTQSNDDPKNLILLCTTQGLALQQDEVGPARLFHHKVHPKGAFHRHWLEVETTNHAVGGPQVETEAEQQDALARGKATAAVIGPRAMGTRFNALMTIQIPLKQKKPQQAGLFGSSAPSSGLFGAPPPAPAAGGLFGSSSPSNGLFGAPSAAPPPTSGGFAFGAPSGAPPPPGGGFGATAPAAFGSFGAASSQPFGVAAAPPPTTTTIGQSRAARLSISSQHDWGKKNLSPNPQRHESQRITITIVLYNVVTGGVPSEADVVHAIDDLEMLYQACGAVPRAQATFANSTTPATNGFSILTSPSPAPVQNYNQFPTVQEPPPTQQGRTSMFQPFGQVPDDVQQQVASMPVTYESFTHVHDLALAKLKPANATSESLGESLALFRLANEVHCQLSGGPAASAFYNMACCCSRLAAMCHHGDPSNPEATACLNAAVQWLRAAAAAGYDDYHHMQVDTDLNLVRQQRLPQYDMALQISQAIANEKKT